MSISRTTVEERKALPLASGVLDYFPDALLAVAEVSRVGNEQHHPGQPLHWDKSKSQDEADALLRHLLDRGTRDTDGMRHSAKVAWRALALLQRELDAEAQGAVTGVSVTYMGIDLSDAVDISVPIPYADVAMGLRGEWPPEFRGPDGTLFCCLATEHTLDCPLRR